MQPVKSERMEGSRPRARVYSELSPPVTVTQKSTAASLSLGTAVAVAVAVTLGVRVRDGVRVGDGVADAVPVDDSVGCDVRDGVGVCDGVRVGEAVGELVPVAVGDGVPEGGMGRRTTAATPARAAHAVSCDGGGTVPQQLTERVAVVPQKSPYELETMNVNSPRGASGTSTPQHFTDQSATMPHPPVALFQTSASNR